MTMENIMEMMRKEIETKMFEFEFQLSSPSLPPSRPDSNLEGKVKIKQRERERLPTFVDSQSQLVYFSFEMIDETLSSPRRLVLFCCYCA